MNAAMVDFTRLDRYWEAELGCQPEGLYAGEVQVVSPPHRHDPRWMGWLVPLECIAVAAAPPGAGVISVSPHLATALRDFLAYPATREDCLPPEGRAMFRFAREHLPSGSVKVNHILQCTAETFQPAPEILPITMVQPGEILSNWFRQHFDGPVFAARNEHGNMVSWAALKLKSHDVWEMAVVTEAPYRGRGLARSVVSRATAFTLEHGRLPIYLHDISNDPSAHVCRALGYQFYGYELTCECGRVASMGGFSDFG